MSRQTRDEGTVSAAEARDLARESVAIWKKMVGRGATYASAHGSPGSVSLVFREVLTRSEHLLVEAGQPDLVRDQRRALFRAACDEMVAAMEKSSDTPVETLLYDIDPEHDTCAFTFVFARPRGGDPA